MNMLTSIEFLAVLISGIYGVLLACRKQFDAVGIFTVAFTVAFGGGTLRDILLDRRPLFWIENDHYVMMVMGVTLIGAFLPRGLVKMERFLAIPDALGLALFSIVGTGFAMEAGTSPFIAAIFGVITGTFGGVIAEVICNEIPSLFRSAPLYAICSFSGSSVYLVSRAITEHDNVSILLGVIVVVGFRWTALRWNIQLPNASLDSK
ncbi:trimeric intracellular cation channel family protein [Verrucomicrobia bacterium]|nr:trimeric intracellular cation channel family protein [Verrucomicrobiota bacterium]